MLPDYYISEQLRKLREEERGEEHLQRLPLAIPAGSLEGGENHPRWNDWVDSEGGDEHEEVFIKM